MPCNTLRAWKLPCLHLFKENSLNKPGVIQKTSAVNFIKVNDKKIPLD